MIRTRDDLNAIIVSFFKKKNLPKYIDMPIERVLKGIRNGAYADEVNRARDCLFNGNVEGYNLIKAELPAVSFCATYKHKRKEEEIERYNSLLVFDIDKLEPLEMSSVGKILSCDPFVAAYWLSPSARGYKGLIHLDYEDEMMKVSLKERHDRAFELLFQYMLANYGIELDRSGRDIQRLCFMSSDSSLFARDEAEAFHIVPGFETEESVSVKEKPSSRVRIQATSATIPVLDWQVIYARDIKYENHAQNRSILSFLVKKLRKKKESITDTWENWTKVAFAIASSVHPEKGKDLFLELCRLDGNKHDEAKSLRLIWEAYANNKGMCHMRTIIYLARQKGILLDR